MICRGLSCLAVFVSLVGVSASGCGGGDEPGGDPGGGGGDDPPDCRADDCGRESFRRAVPGRGAVLIDFERAAAARALSAEARPRRHVGPRSRAALDLEPIAPAYLALADHVDEINLVVEDLFAGLEELSSSAPEIEEETVHRWRVDDDELAGYEEVLTLESEDETVFTLNYTVGPAGFDPDEADAVLVGEIALQEGEASDVFLALDFDAATAIDPDAGLTGALEIRSQEFAGGDRELWYDFIDFGGLDGELETSLTTYWVFDDGSGALEYLDDISGDSQATVYARWDDAAGRLDYHVAWSDDLYGVLDEISTDCWGEAGEETFYGWAVIDPELHYYVEMDGEEAACEFGPLDGHPNPSDEFADLPADGEWEELWKNSDPFCEDDPDDPDCIYYCDLFPENC